MTSRRLTALLLLPPAIACVLFGIGFAWFLQLVQQPTPPPPRADAIVALTGGADRIDTALRLLAEDRAGRLLISGVHDGLGLPTLEQRLGVEATALAPRITLGRQAYSTWGNGTETAQWARQNGVRSLIVVTAAYHMPRALIEIGRRLPGVALYPVAVQPPIRPGTNDAGSAGMLLREWVKYLGARLGLGFLSRKHP